MSQLYNRIFGSEGSLTREELLAYLRDELSEQERNRIEQLLANSPLEREALEGLEAHPDAWAHIPKPDSNQQQSWWSNPSYWTMGIAAALVGVLVVVFWPEQPQVIAERSKLEKKQLTEQTAPSKSANTDGNPEPPVLKEETTNVTEESDEPTTESPDESTQKEPAHQTVTATVSEEQSVPTETSTAFEPEDVQVADAVTTEESSPQESPVTTNQELAAHTQEQEEAVTPHLASSSSVEPEESTIAEDTPNELAYINIGTTYYKTVNYDVVKRPEEEQHEVDEEAIRKQSLENLAQSLPPRFGNSTEQVQSEDDGVLFDYELVLHYDYVLEKALEAFKAGQDKLAMERFTLILATYPNDQNALFYSALLLKKDLSYAAAIDRLNTILKSEITLFHEEAKWEKANLLLEQGQVEPARALLQSIADSAGFYQSRANAKLQSLNKE